MLAFFIMFIGCIKFVTQTIYHGTRFTSMSTVFLSLAVMFLPLYVICWWQAEISWCKVQGKMVSQYLILYFLSHNELACNLCLTVCLLERVYQYSCIYLLKYGTLGFPQSDSSSSLWIKLWLMSQSWSMGKHACPYWFNGTSLAFGRWCLSSEFL